MNYQAAARYSGHTPADIITGAHDKSWTPVFSIGIGNSTYAMEHQMSLNSFVENAVEHELEKQKTR